MTETFGGLLLSVALLLLSCATVREGLDPESFYKRDAKICANQVCGNGTLVVPHTSSYKITTTVDQDLDYLLVTTCHREEKFEDGDSGIDDSDFKYTYTPDPTLEGSRYCFFEVHALEKTKGRQSWAMIDFQDDQNILPGNLSCNASEIASSGVSICQSKEGLIQKITFPVEVLVAPGRPECVTPVSSDSKTFEWQMSKGRCTYTFMEKIGMGPSGHFRTHRMTTLGYDQIVVRSF